MKLSDRLIWESEIKKREHDVVLKDGALHRCFDTTMLSEIPTADAVPVVRCKDCQYRGSTAECLESDDDWFCADGKRRKRCRD